MFVSRPFFFSSHCHFWTQSPKGSALRKATLWNLASLTCIQTMTASAKFDSINDECRARSSTIRSSRKFCLDRNDLGHSESGQGTKRTERVTTKQKNFCESETNGPLVTARTLDLPFADKRRRERKRSFVSRAKMKPLIFRALLGFEFFFGRPSFIIKGQLQCHLTRSSHRIDRCRAKYENVQ